MADWQPEARCDRPALYCHPSSADVWPYRHSLAPVCKGWIFCRDHFEACVGIVLQHGPTLGKGHTTWMLNESNALIWPSPLGIGMMDPKAFVQTAQIAQQYQIIKRPPDAGTYRTGLARQALEALHRQGLERQGLGFQKRTVQITQGGE